MIGMTSARYRIGIDVGGTFTDLVAVDEQGALVLAKCASTPPDPSEGLVTGLGLLAAELGTNLRELLAQTETIVHGTTVATNALLERKGAKVGLLTTEGHRDVIEMREGLKDDRYNLRMAPPIPLVPRARRLGVRERLSFDGTVSTPLSLRSLGTAMSSLRRRAWRRWPSAICTRTGTPATRSRPGASWRGVFRACTCRSRPRSCRRSRSTSGSGRLS
jgi:N-methylhydantoinase A